MPAVMNREEPSSLAESMKQKIAALEKALSTCREEVRQGKAENRAILDNIGLGVALISPKMEILDLNRRMRQWFPAIDPGQRPICYRSYNNPPGEQICDYCPTVKTLRDGKVHKATTSTPQDGVVRNFRIVSSPVFNASGEITAAIEIVEDITAQKHADEEREKLMAAIEQTNEAIVITDTEGAIQYVNPSFERITGYSSREALGQNPRILKSGRQEPGFYMDMWTTIRSGKTWKGRIVNKRKDGKFYTEEASISPILDGESGAIVKYVAVKRDITRELEIENRFSQSQRVEAIGALAGGIAHDFNNLLFPIIGLSEMLIDDLPEGSEECDNIREIHRAAQRAGDLVRQILSFSRQSSHDKVPLRIQQVLKEVLKLTRSTIPSNIEIRPEIQQDCGLIMGDPTQIHQIVMNLITNAYHAVEKKGGSISVQLKETVLPTDKPDGNSLEPGKYARLRISDTGHGIDPLILQRVFEPYFSTKSKGKGTGLGLSVVYGILKNLDGDIRVASTPGTGTTFTAYIPLIESISETTPHMEIRPLETGTERILLVDDEEAIVRMVTQMLDRLGYRVTARTSSVDALQLFSENPAHFDVVITDMAMPNMTGDQLARKMISIKPDIPIIICTGFSERISPEQASHIGIKGFLMKPVLKSDLAETVRVVLGEK